MNRVTSAVIGLMLPACVAMPALAHRCAGHQHATTFKPQWPNLTHVIAPHVANTSDLRGMTVDSKLAPDLGGLVDGCETTRGPRTAALLTAGEIRDRFGITPDTPNPRVTVVIHVAPEFHADRLKDVQASNIVAKDDTIIANVAVAHLSELAALPGVMSVRSNPGHRPATPANHVSGHFSSMRKGASTIEETPTELVVVKKTVLSATYGHREEWGLCIAGLDNSLVSATGVPAPLYLDRRNGNIRVQYVTPPANMAGALRMADTARLDISDDRQADTVTIALPPGRYLVYGYGAGEHVTRGDFSLDLPFDTEAHFEKAH